MAFMSSSHGSGGCQAISPPYLFLNVWEPDLWGFIINPLWNTHQTDVEEAWDHVVESIAD